MGLQQNESKDISGARSLEMNAKKGYMHEHKTK
jgi:hypothetical protein